MRNLANLKICPHLAVSPLVVIWCSRQRIRNERNHSHSDGLRSIVADNLCRDLPDIFGRHIVAAMRHGRTALYRPVDWRTPEMERRKLALRIPAQQGQGACRRRGVCGMSRQAQPFAATHYFLHSVKSLSAMENTASALISIFRTTHSRWSR